MLGPMDEFPVHQIPQPIAWPGSSDRNFYDRSYFNAHDRTGDIFLITGIGYYPNLGVKDAFMLVRRGDEQTAVHLSDAVDQDRLNQNVLGYRVEVTEPLHRLRIVLDETEGIAADLTWNGLFDVVQEQRHILRAGTRITLDAQRFAQVGSWSGQIVIDGEEITVDPSAWIGTRDRSWGIRPIGEAEPAGRPADPPFEGMWWLYVPMAFDDFSIVLIIQEEPSGFRSLNDCTRVWKDGRVEQLGWPRVKIHYTSGTRIPTGATIDATAADGTPVRFDVESKLPVPIHVGGGYGGDSDWIHGVWKGDKFTERLTYDMTDPAIIGRAGFGVIDHVGRAVCTEGNEHTRRGLGSVRARRAGPSRPVGVRGLAHRRASSAALVPLGPRRGSARARRDHLVHLESPAGHLGMCRVQRVGLIFIGLHQRLDVEAGHVVDAHVRERLLHLVAPQPDVLDDRHDTAEQVGAELDHQR